eukprot:IDg13439t1
MLLAFFSMSSQADAHGCMVYPRYRATLNTNSVTVPDLHLPDMPADHCPHCLNGGGKGAVMLAAKNNWTPWEPLNSKMPFRHDSGLCGDPIADAAPRPHEVGGRYGPPKSMPIVATYRSGSIIEMTADIKTNHNGFFDFFICDAKKCGGDISEACFKNGHCHQLMRVKTSACESQKSRECGPIDPAYPGRWYVPCRKGGHVGEHFMGGKYMRYKLPAGFKSSHAVLQWYWATANSCNPPGFKEYFDKYPMPGWGRCPGDGGALGGRNPTLSKCGGSTFPEEFWMCADVSVTSSGDSIAKRRPKIKKLPIRAPTAAHKKRERRRRTSIKRMQRRPNNEMRPRKTAASARDSPKMATPNRRTRPVAHSSKPVSGVKASRDCTQKLEFRDDDETIPDVPTAKCASKWKQCGGSFFKGANECCDRRFECIALNKYYAQCKAPRRSRN